MSFLVETLEIYKRGMDFVDLVAERCETFPAGYRFLADQLVRAALSIVANVAEGNGRATPADRRNFLVIARGSIHECIPLMQLAHRRGLIGEGEARGWYDALESLARLNEGLMRTARFGGAVVPSMEGKR